MTRAVKDAMVGDWLPTRCLRMCCDSGAMFFLSKVNTFTVDVQRLSDASLALRRVEAFSVLVSVSRTSCVMRVLEGVCVKAKVQVQVKANTRKEKHGDGFASCGSGRCQDDGRLGDSGSGSCRDGSEFQGWEGKVHLDPEAQGSGEVAKGLPRRGSAGDRPRYELGQKVTHHLGTREEVATRRGEASVTVAPVGKPHRPGPVSRQP